MEREEALQVIRDLMREHKINIHEVQHRVKCPQSPDGNHKNEPAGRGDFLCAYCGTWNASN